LGKEHPLLGEPKSQFLGEVRLFIASKSLIGISEKPFRNNAPGKKTIPIPNVLNTLKNLLREIILT